MFIKTVEDSGFSLSVNSLNRLSGVDERLVRVVKRAIQITKMDFGVSQGLRTQQEQERLVADGKSMTMDSKHLKGLAVDLFAYANGKALWEVEDYVYVVYAMQQAAREEGLTLRWGGNWGLLEAIDNPLEAVHKYIELRKSQGRRPFVDAPHFEIV